MRISPIPFGEGGGGERANIDAFRFIYRGNTAGDNRLAIESVSLRFVNGFTRKFLRSLSTARLNDWFRNETFFVKLMKFLQV